MNLAPGEESAELLPHCDKILLKGDVSVDQDFSGGCHVDLYGDGECPSRCPSLVCREVNYSEKAS